MTGKKEGSIFKTEDSKLPSARLNSISFNSFVPRGKYDYTSEMF